ncbi:MAG: DUF4199 domain-containing protein [Prevotella sp.]|nr:DUF4199 domain-containing protein [Prevotella sp.]
MTPEEYKQLKAFARVDGALMALLWVVSFACYIQGMDSPTLNMLSITLIVITPFYAAHRLRRFRDYAREGSISFRRGYAYVIYTFFYAGLLFALAQYVYFAYMDKGFLLGKFTEIMSAPESVAWMQANGLSDMIKDSLDQMAQMRPIDFSLNMLTLNIIAGFIVGLPVAALTQQRVIKKVE